MPNLIPNWRQAWKYHTVLLAAALGALNFAHEHSVELAAILPSDIMAAINRWTPLVLIVVRLIQQPSVATAAPAPAVPAPSHGASQ